MKRHRPRPSSAAVLLLCSSACRAFSSPRLDGRFGAATPGPTGRRREPPRADGGPFARGPSDAPPSRDDSFFARTGRGEPSGEVDVDDPSGAEEDARLFRNGGGTGDREARYEHSHAAANSPSAVVERQTENTSTACDYSPSPQNQTFTSAQEPTYATSAGSNAQTNSESTASRPISSLDARVLESILQEGKLDLSTEQQVKKLLQGPRAIGEDQVTKEAAGGGEYQSKFVSKISDDTFWNSLKAKADSILESLQIYIENRIERDAQTLAAIGLFTLDRAKRDISRALPAAGRRVKNFILASDSTHAERPIDAAEKAALALPPSEPSPPGASSYEELTTPADEIRRVAEAIRDILSGKEISGSSASSRRGVRSLAPAGAARTAERQRRAYRARKKTVLRREMEGIDRTLGRAIGSVTDAAWELRQEMNSGAGREAGYRSKGVRKALAAGAVRLLEAGREGGRLLLGGRSDEKLAGEVYAGAGAKSADVDFVDAEVDPIQEGEIIDEVIEETNLEYAPDGSLSPESFLEEKRRLVTSLESCLSQPGRTWLTKEVVSQATQSGIGLDGEMLRQVITSMVTLRDELKEEVKEEDDGDRSYLKIDYVQRGLRRMKEMVDGVTSLASVAAGEGAARLLKTELQGFVLSDSLDEIIEIELERLEQLLAEMVATREREIKARSEIREVYAPDPLEYSASFVEVVEQEPSQSRPTATRNRFNDVVFTEVEVEPQTSNYQQAYMQGEDSFTYTDEDAYQFSGSTVEVVSDEEYSDYEQRFKTVQSSEWIDDGEEEERKGDNPVGKFVLRVIDAIFFVGEKFFLVGLPSLISTGSNISFRYSQAQNRGSGTVGWQPLKNLKRKKNQY